MRIKLQSLINESRYKQCGDNQFKKILRKDKY